MREALGIMLFLLLISTHSLVGRVISAGRLLAEADQLCDRWTGPFAFDGTGQTWSWRSKTTRESFGSFQ